VIIPYSVDDMHCREFIKYELLQGAYFNLPVVGIAASYGVDGPGIESRWGGRAFYTVGTGALPGIKRLGCGADHSTHLAPLGLCGLF
jgi:hypothetical protein